MFGSYEIAGELGRGGMGIVYRARQPGLDRDVALKTLLVNDFTGEDDVERFLSEARTLARLKHPGIVPIFDSGRVGERIYFTMPLLEGVSLDELLAGYGAVGKPSTTLGEMVTQVRGRKSASRRPLPVVHAVTLARRVLDALGYAHERGVIHRDIKPSNIFITEAGDVVLMDFGLARAKAGSSRPLTISGTILGTPAYMAPEQARGDARKADERSDLYAAGSVLYEMLSGRPVLECTEDLARDLMRIIEENPDPLRKIDPSIPRDLETVVHKALEKEPLRRYASCAAMSEDLRRFLGNEPILARPPSAAYLARKWVLRHRTASAAFLVGLVAALAWLGTAVWGESRRRADRRSALSRAREGLEVPADLEKALDEARRAAGDGNEPEAIDLRRLIAIRSAERWISLDRYDMALGVLEDSRIRFPRDPRLAELFRVAEGSGTLTIDSQPSGADVYLWRQEDLERAVDAWLADEDRRCLERLRRALREAPWQTVGLYDFRRGRPAGIALKHGEPSYEGGLRPGLDPVVAVLPARTRGPTRVTIRGRIETGDVAAWWLGHPWKTDWFGRCEGRLTVGASRSVELRWEDSRLALAEVEVGGAFEIVFEWALGGGRVVLNDKVVLESAAGAMGDEGEETGLAVRGGVVLEEVRVEAAPQPEAAADPRPEPRVEPAHVGTTPIRNLPLKMGSAILELRAEGRSVRYPVHITRNRAWDAGVVRLDYEVPGDLVYVPGNRALPDFAISRCEVTKLQFWKFLQDFTPELRKRWRPGHWTMDLSGPKQGPEDWGYGPYDPVNHPEQDDEPVGFVRVEAAMAYGEWLKLKTGRSYRLPTSEEWEKAACGVDGREYPWGAAFHPRRAKLGRVPKRLADVQSFALGASPYGALHMSGHIAEWTSTLWRGESWAGVVKGGSYLSTPGEARGRAQQMLSVSATREDVGFRVLLDLAAEKRK